MSNIIKVAKYIEDKHTRKMLSGYINYIDERLEELSQDNNDIGLPSGEKTQLRWIKRIIAMVVEYGIESVNDYYKSVVNELQENGETKEIRTMASNINRLLKYDESKWESKVASV